MFDKLMSSSNMTGWPTLNQNVLISQASHIGFGDDIVWQVYSDVTVFHKAGDIPNQSKPRSPWKNYGWFSAIF